jgi:glycine cleavage system H protein
MAALLPPELRYTGDHLWVRREDPLLRIGITSVAGEALGEIVQIDVPEVDLPLVPGEPFSWIETSKAVCDLLAPLPGHVREGNAALAADPELLRRDPYGAGWICTVAPARDAADAALLDAEAYAALARAVG